MNDCDKYRKDSCGCGECHPASYRCDFDITPNPFNESEVNITMNGATKTTKIPIKETDTKLSVNSVDNTLNYSAERHTDVMSGDQLGQILRLENLGDVSIDKSLPGTCTELIFHKYGNCGEGCVSSVDAWSNFNINSEGAKQDWLNYVRGTNAYGCPVYLDEPIRPEEYWFAGWRQDGEHHEFGYYQPRLVDNLPTNENGDTMVMSEDPTTKEPIVGPLPIQKWIKNLINNLAMEIETKFSVIQETPAFSGYTNPVTGDFRIDWSDWETDVTPWKHCGSGVINGKVNWTQTFDLENGRVNYHINSVYFRNVVYTVDQGYTGANPIHLTIKGVSIPGGQQTTVLNNYTFLPDHSWTENLNKTINCDQTISVAPGGSAGPFNFAYLYVDWTQQDDEGYMQITFKNKLIDWEQ